MLQIIHTERRQLEKLLHEIVERVDYLDEKEDFIHVECDESGIEKNEYTIDEGVGIGARFIIDL